MLEIIKTKDMDRRCHSCGACMKTEFNDIDKMLGTTHTPQVYEMYIGQKNNRTQVILCKNCLEEMIALSEAILEGDKRK